MAANQLQHLLLAGGSPSRAVGFIHRNSLASLARAPAMARDAAFWPAAEGVDRPLASNPANPTWARAAASGLPVVLNRGPSGQRELQVVAQLGNRSW